MPHSVMGRVKAELNGPCLWLMGSVCVCVIFSYLVLCSGPSCILGATKVAARGEVCAGTAACLGMRISLRQGKKCLRNKA